MHRLTCHVGRFRQLTRDLADTRIQFLDCGSDRGEVLRGLGRTASGRAGLVTHSFGRLRHRFGSPPHSLGGAGQRRHDTGDRVAEVLGVLLHCGGSALLGSARGFLFASKPPCLDGVLFEDLHSARHVADLVLVVTRRDFDGVVTVGEPAHHAGHLGQWSDDAAPDQEGEAAAKHQRRRGQNCLQRRCGGNDSKSRRAAVVEAPGERCRRSIELLLHTKDLRPHLVVVEGSDRQPGRRICDETRFVSRQRRLHRSDQLRHLRGSHALHFSEGGAGVCHIGPECADAGAVLRGNEPPVCHTDQQNGAFDMVRGVAGILVVRCPCCRHQLVRGSRQRIAAGEQLGALGNPGRAELAELIEVRQMRAQRVLHCVISLQALLGQPDLDRVSQQSVRRARAVPRLLHGGLRSVDQVARLRPTHRLELAGDGQQALRIGRQNVHRADIRY